MIDPRSRQGLEHPFPGVDGEHVLVVAGQHAGSLGVVQFQIEHSITGVICRVRLSPGGESADISASQLRFLPHDNRPRDLRGVMDRPRSTPGPRFVVVPTGWGVFDRHINKALEGHTGLTYEAAEALAAELGDDADPTGPPSP